MSVRRMSFNETPDWQEVLGFVNRLSFGVDAFVSTSAVVVRKGGIVHGFGRDGETAGYVLDDDVALTVPAGFAAAAVSVFYVTMDANGRLRLEAGNFAGVRGMGDNAPGIPWYTFNGGALVGKVFAGSGIVQGTVVCDDPFWCEFEGTFSPSVRGEEITVRIPGGSGHSPENWFIFMEGFLGDIFTEGMPLRLLLDALIEQYFLHQSTDWLFDFLGIPPGEWRVMETGELLPPPVLPPNATLHYLDFRLQGRRFAPPPHLEDM